MKLAKLLLNQTLVQPPLLLSSVTVSFQLTVLSAAQCNFHICRSSVLKKRHERFYKNDVYPEGWHQSIKNGRAIKFIVLHEREINWQRGINTYCPSCAIVSELCFVICRCVLWVVFVFLFVRLTHAGCTHIPQQLMQVSVQLKGPSISA